MDSKYSSWTVIALKNELRSRNAHTQGKKCDLIKRLDAYDRNNNFLHWTSEIVATSTTINCIWPRENYQNLKEIDRPNIPEITERHVANYFILRYGCDKNTVGDVKAINKGKLLTNALRIKACSFLDLKSEKYFTGIVGASMKKHVSYNVKIKMSQQGDILNADCECPSGKGPLGSCKHSAAICLMLVNFSQDGNLLVESSCTEKLQTFHRPNKLYKGKISKMQELYPSPSIDLPSVDDGYSDHVRTTLIRHCASTSNNLALKYVYPKADIAQAVKDHDYTKRPFTEYWIDRALHVSEEEGHIIERQTISQSDCKKWYKVRQWRITASRFGEIVKATSRRNYALLCEDLLASKTFSNPATLHGRTYESAAIAAFSSITGIKTEPCGIFIHSKYPYLGATPDACILPDGLVEVKCPYNGRNSNITTEENILHQYFPFLVVNNQRIELNRDHRYYYQVQGQMGLSKKSYCYFIVYTFKELFIEKIAFDEAIFQQKIIPILSTFYRDHWRPFLSKKLSC